MESNISFTPLAIEEINRIKKNLVLNEKMYLRLGIRGGGCSGIAYRIAFDYKTEQDEVFTINTIDCIIDKTHIMHILGMTIDFETDSISKGFVFLTD